MSKYFNLGGVTRRHIKNGHAPICGGVMVLRELRKLEKQLTKKDAEIERLRERCVKAEHDLDLTWCAIPSRGITSLKGIKMNFDKLKKGE